MLTDRELDIIRKALLKYSEHSFTLGINEIMPKLLSITDRYVFCNHFSKDHIILRAGMSYNNQFTSGSFKNEVEATLRNGLSKQLTPYMLRDCLGGYNKTYEFASICVKLPN